MLTVEHVQKRYGSVQALVDANLEVQPGEIHALLGPNGAGKTTLIKILATLLIKDGGRVEILGHDLDRDPESIRHLVGYVGQDTERSAYARLTVTENLRFFGRLRGLTRREIDEQIDKLAGYFDFRRHLDKLFVTLSGGQKQTVVIMRAFLHDPPLIYLDEPTKGLDPIIAKRIRSFLRRLVQEEGKSLLLTSHVLSEVEELADRVSLIHGGRIPITGAPAALKRAVGASDFIEVRQDGLPDAIRARILALEPVLFAVERTPGWISFGMNDPLAGAQGIIDVLREAGVTVEFRHRATTLEDAFIHHIGGLSEQFDH